ncbi:TIM-barrel domain-containing protein [Absiella sp. AM54-8XD]|uniref:TIM-barrel domain-containing protein n=1 Tax=Absiella sp. AM54-8XD TaxID=2292279 RepID=UPI0013141DB4|nr:TIM-barrel domain-containing protein [Absiella sp. AM54-8XD]
MKNKAILKKIGPVSLATVMSLTGIYGYATPLVQVHAAEDAETQLGSIIDVKKVEKNIVEITYQNGYKGRVTFLENGIFRFNVDPSGKFEQYATPNSKSHKATIQTKSDESDDYSKPEASLNDENGFIQLSAGNTIIEFDKTTGMMSAKRTDGTIVFKESKPLSIGSGSTTQTLATSDDEYFYGGGTQNGRFSHKGKSINIKNEGGWTDGQVSSPNPFYWSNKGYGVLRNTFKEGKYDFAKSDSANITTSHDENEFDAYYFISDSSDISTTANNILNEYYEVTGNPVLLPEYGYYLAHLNCYNRDGWQEGGKEWKLEDGKWYEELGQSYDYVIPEGTKVESLNNTPPSTLIDNFKGVIDDSTKKFTAQAVIEGHEANDMPLGWFLPNDGYGCGYGQNGYHEERTDEEKANNDWTRATQAVDANVNNLKDFTDFANQHGIQVGLWTQAALNPEDSELDGMYKGFQTLRDFNKEVNTGGVRALKTDVAWVGEGYSMALNSVKTGYDVLAKTNTRPMLVSLDGWAGSQRYTSMWTGDQYGGQWEYIRFHIPTYIGQSLSGNPNVASDMDGIFSGDSITSTRDYEWKTFTSVMLDMDGWGSLAKKPYYNGDPYTGINRMYLKLRHS